jgi:general secretion pathway protein A
MYLDFFDLQREPFQVTPDPAFFYLFPSHREALAAILYGVEQRKGFVAIIGEVGVGKTTILRAFLDRLDRDRTKVIYLLNADVAFGDLLRSLLQEFGIVPAAETTFAMENQLHRFLIEQFRQDRNVALIIDEAQNMPVQTMEGLRVLSNLETTTDKLLQIVFCGQPELEQKLAQPELRQLKQRIAVQARVAPLTPAESVCYIQHRLSTAGVAGTAVFDKGAIDQIVAAAQGIPRVINILCDNALATALGYQERRVTRRIAKEIVRDHEGKLFHSRTPRWPLATAMGAGAAAALGAGLLFLGSPGGLEPVGDATPTRTAPRTQRYMQPIPQIVPVTVRTSSMTALAAAADGTPEDVQTPGSAKDVAQPLEAGGAVPTPVHEQEDRQPNGKRLAAATVDEPNASAETEVKAPRAEEVTGQPAAPHQSSGEPVTRTVRPGDRLIELVAEVYGERDLRLVQLVQKHNPQVKNANLIYIGDRLIFPSLDDLGHGR